MIRTILLILAVLATHEIRAQSFNASWYHLQLTVDPGGFPELTGLVRVEGTAVGDLMSVPLKLAETMVVHSVMDGYGAPVSYRHEDDMLWLDYPLVDGARLTADIRYAGTPATTGFGSWTSGTVSSGAFFWSLSEPYGASEWWPNNDHPSDKADSVRVEVRVPDPIRVGSNGLLESVTKHGDGTTTWDWIHRYPIATYLVSVAAGTYDVYEQVYERPDSLVATQGAMTLPILHYVYAGSDAFDGINHFSGWKRVMDVFPVLEYWYGPYPYASEKYGHAQATFRGGMEHQTMSTMGNIGLNLVTHELAHQWFGNSMGLATWQDLWLNEGFATQSEILFMESDPVAYADEYTFLFNLYRDRALTAEGTLVLADTSNVSSMFAFSRVYGKGWMVLRMLRSLMGDDAYRAALHLYTASPGLTSTDGLQAVLEQVSGRDLNVFFDQWVRVGFGHPVLEVDWKPLDGPTGWSVDVTVRQVQSDESNVPAFFMPAPIRVETAAGSVDFHAELHDRVETFRIALPAAPLDVRFDPDGWALWSYADMGTGIDKLSGESGFDLYPNPGRGVVIVEVPGPDRLEVVDMTGRTVLSRDIPAGKSVVDVMELPSGVYLARTSRGIKLLTVLPP